MNEKKIAKILSLVFISALLISLLTLPAGAADSTLPRMPELEGLPGEFSTDSLDEIFSADLRKVAANAVSSDKPPLFYLWLSNGSSQAPFTAFYAKDPATGNAYLLSFAHVGTLIEEGFAYSLEAVGNIGGATYLGNDGVFAYFDADGLGDYQPLTLGTTPSTSVRVCCLLPDNSGHPESVTYLDVDLSQWFTENNLTYGNPEGGADSSLFYGMPVLSEADGTVVGMTYRVNQDDTNYLWVVLFTKVADYPYPEEYAVSASPSGASQGGSPDTTSGGESGGSEVKKFLLENKNLLYILVVVAAVGGYLFYRKNSGKNPKKEKEGTVSLDQQAAAKPQDFDQSLIVSGDQDAYGPTVNNSLTPWDNRPSAGATRPVAVWQLRAVDGPLSGKVYPLNGKLSVGRSSRCDIKFPDDAPGISGSHCEVEETGDQAVLRDLNSTYGTYLGVNNRLSPGRDYPLHAGDVFTLAQGGATFRLERAGAAQDADLPAVKDMNGKVYRADSSGRITFGRNPGCQVEFGESDSSVSAKHCVLYRENGKLYLMDLNSTNGTFFSQRERLKPNEPYCVRKGMAFFLTAPKYTFVVTEE